MEFLIAFVVLGAIVTTAKVFDHRDGLDSIAATAVPTVVVAGYYLLQSGMTVADLILTVSASIALLSIALVSLSSMVAISAALYKGDATPISRRVALPTRLRRN